MNDAPDSLKIPDHERGYKALKALKAMYGFSDAPLMFQLALLQCTWKNPVGAPVACLIQTFFTGWSGSTIVGKSTLLLTAHELDDSTNHLEMHRSVPWIHKQLEACRFDGTLKRQTMPYMHAGIRTRETSIRHTSFAPRQVLQQVGASRSQGLARDS